MVNGGCSKSLLCFVGFALPGVHHAQEWQGICPVCEITNQGGSHNHTALCLMCSVLTVQYELDYWLLPCAELLSRQGQAESYC